MGDVSTKDYRGKIAYQRNGFLHCLNESSISSINLKTEIENKPPTEKHLGKRKSNLHVDFQAKILQVSSGAFVDVSWLAALGDDPVRGFADSLELACGERKGDLTRIELKREE